MFRRGSPALWGSLAAPHFGDGEGTCTIISLDLNLFWTAWIKTDTSLSPKPCTGL